MQSESAFYIKLRELCVSVRYKFMKKIIILDDDESILGTLKDFLLLENFEVILFTDPKKCLSELINGAECDFLLTDIGMPELDGYSLYMKLKDERTDIKVIFMTGFRYDYKHNIVKAKLEGLKYCLFKPFKLSKLLNVINNY
jgi:DNA-binding response OmpR family regulator